MAISVLHDPGFNHAADTGAFHPGMHEPAIDMPNLASLLRGFDEYPPPPSQGWLTESAAASAQAWGADFGSRVDGYAAAAKDYWASPSVPSMQAIAPTIQAAPAPSIASAPMMAAPTNDGVRMDGLKSAFSKVGEPQASNPVFEGRYAGFRPRRNDLS